MYLKCAVYTAFQRKAVVKNYKSLTMKQHLMIPEPGIVKFSQQAKQNYP